MVDRIKTAVAAKRDPDFVIMARTDAFANEGLDAALVRAKVSFCFLSITSLHEVLIYFIIGLYRRRC